MGERVSTMGMAHNSATAAESYLEGGEPHPYPRSLPHALVTTMPKPVTRMSAQDPPSMEPSQYQCVELSRRNVARGPLSI